MPKHFLSCALLLSLLLLAPHADRGGAPRARQPETPDTAPARAAAGTVPVRRAAVAAAVPAPEDGLGFRPGDDR